MEKAQGKLTSDNHASCSGLPALFGVSGYETRNEYLDSRIRARLGENVRSEKGIHAEMGNILENPILEITTEKLGLANLEKNISTPVLHEEYPLGGSIDGIAYCQNNLITPDDEIIYTEDDKPIMLDYWTLSQEKKIIIGVKEDGEKLLVKSEEEYTSPVIKIYKVETEYLVITENSIYIVDVNCPTKRIS